MQETRRRLRVSPSLVISIFALVIAMSAGAYAATIAPKNSVVSKSIKNKNVKAADIKPAAVKKKHLGANSVDSSKIVDGQVGSSEIADGGVGTNDLSAAAKTDLNDASTLGGLTIAQIVAASGGEYYEAKQAPGNVDIKVNEGDRVTLATLNLPHAGKYLINARVPVTCTWDETGADPDLVTGALDTPYFAAMGTLQVNGTIEESQPESCEVENFIDGGVLVINPDVWRGSTTIEFTRMVTVAGPSTITVTGSNDTSLGFLSPIQNWFESNASASEAHIQAITVQ